MKILNLYAGLLGNADLWDSSVHEITHVEIDPKIAAISQRRKPEQKVIIADAHQFLIDHFEEYDFIWASRPCQKHSKMNKFTRHNMRRYVDGALFEEIIFLESYFKGIYVVENVVPYYAPYGNPVKIGRHLFWSNRAIEPMPDYPRSPKGMMKLATVEAKKTMMDWLGIHYSENVYYEKNHCPVQILRNCVHPLLGLHVFNSVTR